MRILVAALVFVAAAAAAAAGPRIALAPGDPAPELVVHAWPGGAKVTLGYDGHRLTVVNFWATWCPPCFDEMPALQRLHERRADDGLRVIGVYVERVGWRKVQQTVEPMGIGYQLAMAHTSTDAAWGGIHSLPTTFLVDDGGRIVRRYVGATPPQIEGMVADIEAFLDGEPLPDLVLPEADGSVSGPGSPLRRR